MVKDKEKNKGYTREFRSDDPTTILSHKDQQKAMLLDTIDDAKAKPKKKVMEPIEIPPIISVPRYHISPTRPGRDMSHLSFGGPEKPVGLHKRFTQERLHEGKILKQIDRELANDERKDSEEKTKEEIHD